MPAHQRHRVADRFGSGLRDHAGVIRGCRRRRGDLQLRQGENFIVFGSIPNDEHIPNKLNRVIHVNGGVHCFRRLAVDLIGHCRARQAAHTDLHGGIGLGKLHHNGLTRLEIDLILRADVDKVFVDRNICIDRAI